jgi:hypothetical protein
MGSVRRFQDFMLLKHGQCSIEAGVEFGGQCHEMHGGRRCKSEQSGEDCHEPQCRHASEQAHERGDHEQGGADFFDTTGGLDQPSTPFQRRVARVILNGVADFMRCNGDRSERVTVMFVGRQANSLGNRVVVVAAIRWLNDNARKAILVQQVPGEAGAGAGIAVLRLTVFLEHALHPDSRTENQGERQTNYYEVCHWPIVTAVLQNVACRVVLALKSFIPSIEM